MERMEASGGSHRGMVSCQSVTRFVGNRKVRREGESKPIGPPYPYKSLAATWPFNNDSHFRLHPRRTVVIDDMIMVRLIVIFL
jgi:hypothetical protein